MAAHTVTFGPRKEVGLASATAKYNADGATMTPSPRAAVTADQYLDGVASGWADSWADVFETENGGKIQTDLKDAATVADYVAASPAKRAAATAAYRAALK